MFILLLQLLKAQDELERLRAEKQIASGKLNELQDQNTSLMSRLYDRHFVPVTGILYCTYSLF